MINRYSRKEIKDIWEDYNKYSIWLNIELAAAESMEKLKIIPRGVSKKVRSKSKIDVKKILKIEEKVKHDVIAFLTSISEKVGKEARYLHKGMTSSDVLDTCFNLQLKQCAISGAVGTFANVDHRVEKYVAKKLKLNVEPVSTQVIPRDRHAQFFSTLGIIASSIERLATEIRHLQRTEVLEVEEFFGKKQKGSSAMPHKKNPILSENLTGLARLIRASVIPSLENIALWHERDISHSAVERNIGPDSTIALDFALVRLSNVVKNLNIYPKKMIKNLNLTNGIFFSQRILLELTNVGFSREEAYKIVQKNALKAWNEKSPFLGFILNDKKITKKIPVNKLKKLFDFNYHTKKIDIIFKRSLKKSN